MTKSKMGYYIKAQVMYVDVDTPFNEYDCQEYKILMIFWDY
jgi:hypothetical protein